MSPAMVTDAPSLSRLEGRLDRSPSPEIAGLLAALRRAAPSPEWDFARIRADFEQIAARMPLPDGVRAAPVEVAGRPAELLVPEEHEDRICVYLHGGAFTIGSIDTVRALAARFAQSLRTRALVVDYRLAPEHPWPAAHDDATAAIAWAQGRARHVLVAGDSAGGGLAIASAAAAVGDGCVVDAVVAMSPWTDLELPYARAMDLVEDPQAPRWLLERSAVAYRGSGDVDEASPVKGPLESLPPTLVQVGTAESLLEDSLRLARLAHTRGIDLDLEVWEGMPHVWQAFAPRLEAAQTALESAGRWIDRRLSARV